MPFGPGRGGGGRGGGFGGFGGGKGGKGGKGGGKGGRSKGVVVRREVAFRWVGGTDDFKPFCGVEQSMDATSTVDRGCPETISALYGVQPGDLLQASSLELDSEGVVLVRLSEAGIARARSRGLLDLHTLCEALGGESVVQQLSRKFYTRLRADRVTDRAFHEIFTRQRRPLEEVARQQSAWFIEMWGGPRRYTELFGEGMLWENLTSTKHTNNMTLGWACLWLQHMDAAMRATLPRETRRQRQAAITILVRLLEYIQPLNWNHLSNTIFAPPAIQHFWRHFLAFFPFDPQERKHITRQLGSHAEHWL